MLLEGELDYYASDSGWDCFPHRPTHRRARSARGD